MEDIQICKQIIESSPTGHLYLPYRIMLRKQLKKSDLINKTYLECAKKVFPIWDADYPGINPVYEMLQKANSYLYYHKGNRSDFWELADNHKNYIEMLNSDAGAAGITALYLCYSIASGASFDENYNGTDDDNAFDYEDFLPDYYGSIAYSGGNPFNDSGDEEKRREYWTWYIAMVETLVNDPQKPLLPLAVISPQSTPKEHFTRSEYIEATNIKDNIRKTIQLMVELVAKKNIAYDKLLVECECLEGGSSYTVSTIVNDKQRLVKISIEELLQYGDVIDFLYDVKINMYTQHPKEGAWCICHLLINKNQTYKITFDYDDKNIIYKPDMDDSWFIAEFQEYPRAKEYTPSWWKSILGNKTKYLE